MSEKAKRNWNDKSSVINKHKWHHGVDMQKQILFKKKKKETVYKRPNFNLT